MSVQPQAEWAEKDYYAVLGVTRDVSAAELAKTYKRLAKRHHPDANPGDASAEERFKEIAAAYAVLSDPETRTAYDQYRLLGPRARPGGMSGVPPGAGLFGTDGLSDLLADLIAGAGRAGQRGPGTPLGRGQDIETEITIAFLDAARGGPQQIDLQLPGGERRTVRVQTPAGLVDGRRLRIKGKGQPGASAPGDLYVTVRVAAHPQLRIDGMHLHAEVSIPAWLGALGGETVVEGLEGPVRLKVPAGTQSGTVLRVRQHGCGRGPDRGDLRVRISLGVPKTLNTAQRAAFEALRDEG